MTMEREEIERIAQLEQQVRELEKENEELRAALAEERQRPTDA